MGFEFLKIRKGHIALVTTAGQGFVEEGLETAHPLLVWLSHMGGLKGRSFCSTRPGSSATDKKQGLVGALGVLKMYCPPIALNLILFPIYFSLQSTERSLPWLVWYCEFCEMLSTLISYRLHTSSAFGTSRAVQVAQLGKIQWAPASQDRQQCCRRTPPGSDSAWSS